MAVTKAKKIEQVERLAEEVPQARTTPSWARLPGSPWRRTLNFERQCAAPADIIAW